MFRAAAKFAVALTAAAALVSRVQALPNVTRAGKYLYTDSGRFYIKGIAYQEQGAVVADPNNPFGEPSSFFDPLSNGDACNRDLPFLKNLGVNTIRAYSVNASLNHDACMSAFEAAGIYTIIDLSLPGNGSIDRLAPTWTTNLLNLYIESIDAFSKYTNVLAYNIGNEVIINPNGTAAAAYVKAAARDVKAYLAFKKSPALVGYAAIDGAASWRLPLADYFSCDPSGTNSGATALDLYGLNSYGWCGDSTFEASYAGITTDYTPYNIPVYLSEFGCITSPPRLWTEVAALFSSQMTDVWSGGLAFSYFPATSAPGQFGMVTISADGRTVTTSADFDRLQAQYAAVLPANTPDMATAGATQYPSCPTPDSNLLASTTLPPTPNDGACNCMQNAVSCRFTPQTTNTTAIVGELLNYACSQLGTVGGSCADLAGDGSTGSYGRVSGCSPSQKLSFVFSEFYETTSRNRESCSFAGNATINPAAPSNVAAANAAVSSCLSSAGATFTPTAPAAGGGSTATSTARPSGSSGNGAATLYGDRNGLWSLCIVVAVSVTSGLWTLS